MFQVDIEAPAAYPMQIVKEACLTPPYGDARAWVHHNTLTTAVCVALEFSEAWGVLAQHRDRKVFKLIQETAQIVEAIGLECMPEILQLDHMLGTEIALVWPREGLPGLRTNAARGPMAGAK